MERVAAPNGPMKYMLSYRLSQDCNEIVQTIPLSLLDTCR